MSSWFFCMLYKKYLHFTLMNYLLTHIGIHECISICNVSCDVLFNVILCKINFSGQNNICRFFRNEGIWGLFLNFFHWNPIFLENYWIRFKKLKYLWTKDRNWWKLPFPWIIYRIFLISCGKFYFFLVSQKELKTEKAESKVFFSILYSKGT